MASQTIIRLILGDRKPIPLNRTDESILRTI